MNEDLKKELEGFKLLHVDRSQFQNKAPDGYFDDLYNKVKIGADQEVSKTFHLFGIGFQKFAVAASIVLIAGIFYMHRFQNQISASAKEYTVDASEEVLFDYVVESFEVEDLFLLDENELELTAELFSNVALEDIDSYINEDLDLDDLEHLMDYL
jgi:hypothetical protein